jgi:hypothetical protein
MLINLNPPSNISKIALAPTNNDNENEEDEEEANTWQSIPAMTKQSNKCTRQIARQKELKIIINSGATSHFMSEDLQLPTEGTSNKVVFLLHNRQLQKSNQTKLLFEQLLDTAWEADVLPWIKQSLLSVNKMVICSNTWFFGTRLWWPAWLPSTISKHSWKKHLFLSSMHPFPQKI